MKILVVGSHVLEDNQKQAQTHIWRLARPMRELAKNVDWQIDHQPTFLEGFEHLKDTAEFTEAELERAFEHLCKYDIVFSSYHYDPTAYSLLKVAQARSRTQYVMDVDDDMFAINPDNPAWMKLTDENVYHQQRMIADNDWITTTTETLAEKFRARRPDKDPKSVVVIPNLLPDDYQHPPFDNSPKIVIGYMGGSSHYRDLHESGVLPAMEKLMHEHKNVYFKSVGLPVDHYLPKARTILTPGQRGNKFLTDVFPKLEFDISIAPLLDNPFNLCKSNIKWQESTRAGAAFVASNVGPYTTLQNGVNAVLVPENTPEAWYSALKKLVERPKLRAMILANAQSKLRTTSRLEPNWGLYKRLFQRVYLDGIGGIPSANNQPRRSSIILQA